MRNAIYGYLAESDNQAKAGYMREVVMPGMARLLHRPAYDFTQPYEYNRSQPCARLLSLPSGPVTTDSDRSVVHPAPASCLPGLLSSWSAHDWRGGIHVDDSAALERLVVNTANSIYEIIVLLAPTGTILVRGGAFFPVFTPARLAGSSAGRQFSEAAQRSRRLPPGVSTDARLYHHQPVRSVDDRAPTPIRRHHVAARPGVGRSLPSVREICLTERPPRFRNEGSAGKTPVDYTDA